MIMRRAGHCSYKSCNHDERWSGHEWYSGCGPKWIRADEGRLIYMRVRMLRGNWSRGTRVRFAPLLCCLTALIGVAVIAAHSQSSPTIFVPSMPHFAIADFDGDNQPDFATVQLGQRGQQEGRYSIGFQLSTGVRQSIAVTAPIGDVQVTLRDVNGDNSLDLVVTSEWLRRPVAILLNDGHGHFTLSGNTQLAEYLYNIQELSPQPQIKDVTALLPSRNISRPQAQDLRIPAPRELGRTPASLLACRSLRFLHSRSLGRAPPTPAICV